MLDRAGPPTPAQHPRDGIAFVEADCIAERIVATVKSHIRRPTDPALREKVAERYENVAATEYRRGEMCCALVPPALPPRRRGRAHPTIGRW